MFYEHQGGWCQGEGLNVTKKLGRVCVSLSHLVVVVVVVAVIVVVVVAMAVVRGRDSGPSDDRCVQSILE